LIGAGVACLALVAFSLWLLRGEVVAFKALVPVWLAALPSIGAGAALGWIVGRWVAPESPRDVTAIERKGLE